MSFSGFDLAAIRDLRRLPSWNAAEYAANRSRFASGLLDPGAALITAIAGALGPDLTAVKRSSVSPLHRDLRFAAKGSSRYKDHLLLTTWEGEDKKTSPTLWLRIDSKGVGFASGVSLDGMKRARWREAIAGRRGEALVRAIKKIESAAKGNGFDVAGPVLKKVPAPWSGDHPRAELLRMNGFQVRFRDPLPKNIEKADFQRWCVARLRRLLPVHDWLAVELGSRSGNNK